jgi:predicted Zn-dependent protease
MKKSLFQALFLILIFAGIFYGLSQVNWMKLFRIEKVTDVLEKQLGDMVWSDMEKKSIESGPEYERLDSVLNAICNGNDLDRTAIKLHLMEDAEVNAFALPDHHMVVYTGLIKEARNNDEIAGVLAHEIAHMELKHVMKKLLKQVGYTILINITTGDAGGEVVKEVLGLLTSSAYDRSLEKDADLKAVEYLKNAKLNVKAFADFLYRLGEENEGPVNLTWISTHPDPKERAKYILKEGTEDK